MSGAAVMRQYRGCECENDEPLRSGPGRQPATDCRHTPSEHPLRRPTSCASTAGVSPGPRLRSDGHGHRRLLHRGRAGDDHHRPASDRRLRQRGRRGVRQFHQPVDVAEPGHGRTVRCAARHAGDQRAGYRGYTAQASIPLQGSVPASVVGKSGYEVNIYAVLNGGGSRRVASVSVGGTTQFITSPITLTEGRNNFVARLQGPMAKGCRHPWSP